MTTIKSPLPRAVPLPCIRSVRTKTPLKPALTAFQPMLPDILPSPVSQKSPNKKRVRFALKLEPLEDPPALPDQDDKLETKLNKRILDPWRTNGPLYGAYVEYLENKEVLTSDINRPMTPVPDFEPTTFTHAFIIRSKSPELSVDSMTILPPARHLPRLTQRPKMPSRKSPYPVLDPDIKPRINLPAPPRPSPMKKVANSNTHKIPAHPPIKRVDFALPSIKPPTSNGKVIRSEQPLGTKIVNEYLQSKKLTEILSNPLPGTNNQINYICGQSILPTLSKLPPTSYHNEPYFFQTHTNDHFQPIIH